MIHIPDFKSTNEAYAFGIKASDDQVKELGVLRKAYGVRFEQSLEDEEWDIASVYATKAQLCREVIESHDGLLVL